MTGEPIQARLRQLRDRGAARLDPARMAHLEELFLRLAAQPEAVRALLEARMELALHALEERVAQVPRQMPRQLPTPTRAAPVPPLPQLPRCGDASEMQSVVRFRRTWTNGRAHERVAAAAARKPQNAGPLNSHMLVLQALDMMQALPGDYLRRFLTHVETLQWLEAAQAPGSSAGKPRRKKAR